MYRSPSGCVKRYLEIISLQPRRGTSSTDLAPIRARLEKVEGDLESEPDPLRRVHMHQEILDLQGKLGRMETERGDFEQIEEEFIANVAQWAERKGVTYEALRAAGVTSRVLRQAGMP